MICITITNASELIASKVGNLIETLTPEQVDQNIVENKLLDKISENLCEQGLEGNISIIKGIEIKEENIIFNNGLNIIKQKEF